MIVDLRSDTVTQPTPAMRHAMMNAEVGDDVFGDDPTVNRLEKMAAAKLGKEAALFTPSGTMANQIAIGLHTRPGDEVLMEANAHPFNYEAGAAAMISGVTIRTLRTPRGILDPLAVKESFRPDDPHFAPLKLICAEDTSNRGGGTVYPLPVLDALGAIAHSSGALSHLDGARLFNAVVQSGVSAKRRARQYDTVSICLSKGLGAPVGSVLCGSADAIHRGRRLRKALGGGMRQAGILAAAGIHALDNHIQRLGEDHRRARILAEGLTALDLAVVEPETNMVYVDIPEARAVVARLELQQVRCIAVGPHTIRMVTHLDVDDRGVQQTLDAFGRCIRA
jgi:threonine aldolase